MDDVSKYIGSQPEAQALRLNQIRLLVKTLAPDAQEKISYGIPTFYRNGVIIHYAGFKNHIGLYALPETNAALASELSPFKQGKGSIQFPMKDPLPIELIEKIVLLRLESLNDAKK